MSHVVKSGIEFTDLALMQDLCKEEGLVWHEGVKTYRWYGRHVGDYKLPEGFSADELGKCEHMIKLPGCDYEIGVVKSKKSSSAYTLIYDFWGEGEKLKKKVGGESCQGLLKKYNEKLVYKQAAKIGCTVSKKVLPTGQIKLTLTGGF